MTLWLNKNATNLCAISGTEKADTEDEFYFLFRFVNEQTQTESFCIKQSSNYPNPRWDKILITMPDDVDLNSGFYHYYVYKSESSESTEWEGLTELENGKLIVPADSLNEKQFTDQEYETEFDYS